MKLDSKYFDSIRVKPEQDRLLRDQLPECDWPGCDRPGTHPAPKSRGNERDYHYFCLAHVREYNKGYNYFAGMAEKDVKSYLDSAHTGHRPTWKLGENPAAPGGKRGARARARRRVEDTFGLFGAAEMPEMAGRPRRSVRNAELKALHELGLDETADAAAVKRQYKILLKRLHPDANKGSRANEDKLQKVIRAHEYLKSSGFLRTVR
ncbi:MAG TPA: molecular chaperone DnaJ [Rhizobiales bacterium]|nr:molecular chaperone DnaJ [Hyphomicrobiales bacterium]